MQGVLFGREMKDKFQIIDTHCHMDMAEFRPDLDLVLERSRRNGVTDFVVPGFIRTGWDRILRLCEQRSYLHASLGLHPAFLDLHRAEDVEELRELSKRKKLAAIGEIGLDFQTGCAGEKEQQELFGLQLSIAREANLPVILHIRKAHDQILAAIRRKHFENGGIVHAFNGSRQQAGHFIKLGFKLGYGGTLTYERAKRIRKVAAEVPLTSIVLETDAPYMPLAGRREAATNSPEYLPEILDTLASLRCEPKDEIAAQTSANARQVLALHSRN